MQAIKNFFAENKHMLAVLVVMAAYILILYYAFGIRPHAIEFSAAALGIISLDLLRRQKSAGFVFGVLSCALLICWFASIDLYGQIAMRAVLLGTNLLGLYFWLRPRIQSGQELKPSWLSAQIRAPFLAILAAVGAAIWAGDGFLSSLDWMSALVIIVGNILLAKKKIDAWILLLVGDGLLGIPLAVMSGSWMVLFMLCFLVIIEISSIIQWRREK